MSSLPSIDQSEPLPAENLIPLPRCCLRHRLIARNRQQLYDVLFSDLTVPPGLFETTVPPSQQLQKTREGEWSNQLRHLLCFEAQKRIKCVEGCVIDMFAALRDLFPLVSHLSKGTVGGVAMRSCLRMSLVEHGGR
jgi:hypothetical protein